MVEERQYAPCNPDHCLPHARNELLCELRHAPYRSSLCHASWDAQGIQSRLARLVPDNTLTSNPAERAACTRVLSTMVIPEDE
jgi:hypothetical protein